MMANAANYVAAKVARGAVTASPVAPGSNAIVSYVAASTICVSYAGLYYRKVGGSATFQFVAMTESTPGANDWSAVIPGAYVGMDGAQFYIEANSTGIVRRPAGAPAVCLTVPVNRSTNISVPTGYLMAGVPFAASNTSPEAVFDELGPYNVKKWRYGTYDPASRVGQDVEFLSAF